MSHTRADLAHYFPQTSSAESQCGFNRSSLAKFTTHLYIVAKAETDEGSSPVRRPVSSRRLKRVSCHPDSQLRVTYTSRVVFDKSSLRVIY
jgi:hypothetical protein